MTREFISTPSFERRWNDLGFGDKELKEIQNILLADPQAGDVIPGLAGARKIRFAASDHGKRGGARVIYVDIVLDEHIFLLTAYPKNVKSDLSGDEKKALAKLVKLLKST
jgi:hypothetical protein